MLLPLLPSFFLSLSLAWNTDVHNQIGHTASLLLTPRTSLLLSSLLEPIYNGSIGSAAAWADAYAHTPEGRFSYQWHWIDTHDWAPDHCSLKYASDCAKGGCVVSAIVNQTLILKSCISTLIQREREGETIMMGEGGNLTCSQALKWVTHFIGDIHQPLHASGRGAGGNLFPVTFLNHSTELHAVWDKYIPYFASPDSPHPFPITYIDPYFSALLSAINPAQRARWLEAADPRKPLECATQWAGESNKWTCAYVYKEIRNGSDAGLDGYASGAVKIAEEQMGKAAVRLGGWLNRLVELVEEEVEGEEEVMEL